ncbi:YgeY family selenium metabolism-linked hydrolase [bacterium]|nr:YgeY family selenium metabolism-linked hydrolase [bacterium]MBU1072750.1 YgeY family selenium metabolism-linked hydrolase [bacterium]MBU1675155.1 YgeY family selenium metabolism-linked hydrolase [bacterium]
MDHTEILGAARGLGEPLIRFLRDIVAIPSLSGGEEAVVRRIAAEMEAVGFDEVKFDGLGNVLGRVGDGPRVVAFDAHIDTVDVTDRDQWTCDPFAGKLEDGRVYGRGAVDQKAGMAGMVYAARLMKDLGLLDGLQVWMVGSVMEEDCDGLCWHYILEEGVLKPEVVVSTEPSGLTLTRGQRGRMEIRVTARGVSCHGSAPERGDNAATKLAPACAAIDALNARLARDDFLGKGSCCVTWFGTEGPSLCAVPDKAELHIDRRLTAGETREFAVREVAETLAGAGIEAEVWILTYEVPSWTGLVYPMEKYYPTWTVPESHPAVQAGIAAHRDALGAAPTVSCWTFSTNGVAIKGLHDVPCVGFGPGEERLAHAPNEYVPVEDVVKACAFYAAYPRAFINTDQR